MSRFLTELKILKVMKEIDDLSHIKNNLNHKFNNVTYY
jgi:hypothetical protein